MLYKKKNSLDTMNTHLDSTTQDLARCNFSSVNEFIYKMSLKVLAVTVWISTLLFGLYILAFYFSALFNGDLTVWNEHLPGLYQEDQFKATTGIGIHFAGGGIILILGCMQLLSSIRERFPKVHHWIGRIYIVSCIATSIGGLLFITSVGTIGGLVMDIGFALYGVLMLLASVQTIRYAMSRDITRHRVWAVRLFALAIGSWLYRMDYGFWALLADSAGHTKSFDGPFDMVMCFFFYLPNLLIAELSLRKSEVKNSNLFKSISSIAFVTSIVLIGLGTYYFTLYYWGPAILNWFI